MLTMLGSGSRTFLDDLVAAAGYPSTGNGFKQRVRCYVGQRIGAGGDCGTHISAQRGTPCPIGSQKIPIANFNHYYDRVTTMVGGGL